MKLKHKALIKDMELQIDYLIGYAPGGFHWKHEETITTHTVKVNDRQNNEFYTIEI